MNAMAPIQADEHAKRSHGPQDTVGRLKEWSRARHYPPVNCFPPESAMYAVLNSPGRSTSGKSDGGLGAKADRMDAAMAIWGRCIEVALLIRCLSKAEAEVIRATYEVPQRENPRRLRAAALAYARHEEISHVTYSKRLDAALLRLSGMLGLPVGRRHL